MKSASAPPMPTTLRPGTEDVLVRRPVLVCAPVRTRRRHSTCARAALLWGAGAFLLIQLGLALAIDSGRLGLRDPLYTDKAEILRRQSRVGKKTVVMLGSSRTVYGLRGNVARAALGGDEVTVFNFGLPGAGPLTELLVLRRLLAEGLRPDAVLVEVLPPLLAGQVRLAETTRFAPEHLAHGELHLVERHLPNERDWRREWWEAWALPCYHQRFAIVSRLAPSLLHYSLRLDWFRAADEYGWVAPPWPQRTPERYRAAVAQAQAEYAYYLDDFQLGGPSPPALRELLELCRAERIPVALVLMPEGSDFRGWYSADATRQVHTFLDGLCREFGVALIDAREWLPDEGFCDSHHPVPAGADRFSARLGVEAIAPLLRDRNCQR